MIKSYFFIEFRGVLKCIKMSGLRFKGYIVGMNLNVYKFFDGFICKEIMEVLYKCMVDNGYDNSKCEDYFKVYRECRKKW